MRDLGGAGSLEITYSDGLIDDIVGYYGTHEGYLVGPSSRIDFVTRRTIVELADYLGNPSSQRILDYGCGTASSTVAIRAHGDVVEGFDIDPEAVAIGERRLDEHGFTDVVLRSGPDAERAGVPAHSFDVVLLNAVIERVPVADRPRVLADVVRCLRPGGVIAIAQSPNRLWPRDVYLTGLWFLPWLPSGSRLAARYAASFGRARHSIEPTADGGRALEYRGVPGISYRGIARSLPNGSVCLNSTAGRRDRSMSTQPATRRRRWFETVIGHVVTPLTEMPVAAFGPMFGLLLFRIPDA